MSTVTVSNKPLQLLPRAPRADLRQHYVPPPALPAWPPGLQWLRSLWCWL